MSFPLQSGRALCPWQDSSRLKKLLQNRNQVDKTNEVNKQLQAELSRVKQANQLLESQTAIIQERLRLQTKECAQLKKENDRLQAYVVALKTELKTSKEASDDRLGIMGRRNQANREAIFHATTLHPAEKKATDLFIEALDQLEEKKWSQKHLLKYWFFGLRHSSFLCDETIHFKEGTSGCYGEILPNALEVKSFSLKWKSASRIVDLGCGPAYLLALMARYHAIHTRNRVVEIDGFEISKDPFDHAIKLFKRMNDFQQKELPPSAQGQVGMRIFSSDTKETT
jgi:myosin heavy subunit